LLVTEDGIARGQDRRRMGYTAAALPGLQAAMDDGAEVRGYLHWSALDNDERGQYRSTEVPGGRVDPAVRGWQMSPWRTLRR
jgi:beta-glucosidase